MKVSENCNPKSLYVISSPLARRLVVCVTNGDQSKADFTWLRILSHRLLYFT